jgi:hypothetical protein
MTLPEMNPKLKSRKLILSLLAAVAPIICSYLSDDVSLHDAMKLSVTAVIGYCVSQGWVDASAVKEKTDSDE